MEGYLLRLPLPECWVVSTLHMLIDAVTESYNKLFFGDVGRERYIEASKARLYHSRDDSVALVAQTVILYIFENILKLITSIQGIRNWGTVAGTPQSERSSHNIFSHIFSLSKATHRVGMICTVHSFMSLQTPFRLFCIFNL
ncbi:hypothetical protein ERO13_D11G349400v2 [Gossypium hirsutum]|uniref:Valine--tRNA ligase, chloroplastic/mitochondrial 2 n=1 Tax=Gossypium hirsutum TaxID=3635 RepID=A0ABM3B2K7_GOSHI|nr:valine--tRNA ligase, chloroplastic/mitochondrial 2-like [Gossypium hirsutum]XP_040961277.1 valine--tRNA ligase, chloroplastic/mitochondrial 2-like [Gossypium hirsutum]XP_040961278.1 valine--tRNA ligase, chloroplastic/mitochondrial 2-like [Gossypium hirsutum]KAG4123807.1 hypothetical protein ERO13_D11G349400v2 [Gossypium hirsutum]